MRFRWGPNKLTESSSKSLLITQYGMARSYRVAVVGKRSYFKYGIQVFNLCADQICRLMEKPHMNKGRTLIRKVAYDFAQSCGSLIYTYSYWTWSYSSNTVQCDGWRALHSNGF